MGECLAHHTDFGELSGLTNRLQGNHLDKEQSILRSTRGRGEADCTRVSAKAELSLIRNHIACCIGQPPSKGGVKVRHSNASIRSGCLITRMVSLNDDDGR